jgi:hypothetical protein
MFPTLPNCVDTVKFCLFEGGGGEGEYEEKVNWLTGKNLDIM